MNVDDRLTRLTTFWLLCSETAHVALVVMEPSVLATVGFLDC